MIRNSETKMIRNSETKTIRVALVLLATTVLTTTACVDEALWEEHNPPLATTPPPNIIPLGRAGATIGQNCTSDDHCSGGVCLYLENPERGICSEVCTTHGDCSGVKTDCVGEAADGEGTHHRLCLVSCIPGSCADNGACNQVEDPSYGVVGYCLPR